MVDEKKQLPPKRTPSTLHFRSMQGGNNPGKDAVTHQQFALVECGSVMDNNDLDNAKGLKKRRGERRHPLHMVVNAFKTSVSRFCISQLTSGKNISIQSRKNCVILQLLFLIALFFTSIVVNKTSLGYTFSPRKEMNNREMKKPRILRLLKSPVGETPSSLSKVTIHFDSIYIPQRQKRLRQKATDWYFFHEDKPKKDRDNFNRVEPFETENCQAMYEWQKLSFPTCNLIHEYQIQSNDIVTNTIQKINYGFFRDVWKRRVGYKTFVVLKTLRTDKQFDEFNADRHRRDAVAMERLTSSPHVVDIYGHCGNSQLTEYSGEGDAYDAVFNPKSVNVSLSKEDALRIAVQVATGIAEVHNLGREGQASMAHTDIAPAQFMLIDGFYKINDFNRVRFIRWNNETNQPCPYQVANNPGEFRSPEEYEYGDQSEKVDIYSMGNVFFVLLTSIWPWDGVEEEKAQKLVMEGKRPPVEESILNSTHPVDIALLKAIDMCHIHDPSLRASAKDVLKFLTGELNEIIPHR